MVKECLHMLVQLNTRLTTIRCLQAQPIRISHRLLITSSMERKELTGRMKKIASLMTMRIATETTVKVTKTAIMMKENLIRLRNRN